MFLMGILKHSAILTKYLMAKRKELKYEFYLPSVKEMIAEALRVVDYAVSEKITDLGQALKISPEQLYKVVFSIRRFSTAFSLYEAHYTATLTLKYLKDEVFSQRKVFDCAKELFQIEKDHGRVVKYPESFSIPKLKVTLKYFEKS